MGAPQNTEPPPGGSAAMTVFDFTPGELPVPVGIPHDGMGLPNAIAERMTEAGHANVDADWHVRRLYDFVAGLGANVSRPLA